MTKFKLIYLLFPLLLFGGCKVKKQSLESYHSTKTVQQSQVNILDSLYTKLFNITYNVTIEEEVRDTAGRITNVKRTKLNIQDNSKETAQVKKVEIADSTAKDTTNYHKQVQQDINPKPITSWIFPNWVWLILAVAVGLGIFIKIK